ncbi:MAG: hypothetical protein ACW99V_10050 [Candidatus Thorarchaeota archaeon]
MKLLSELKENIENRFKAAEAAERGEPEVEEIETISFEYFKKLDLRVGKILECTKVPKTKKLLEIKVDLGFEERTMVTGLADQYKPEELKGLTALFLTNLEPKKIGGIESKGMILAVERADDPGKWVPVTVEGLPPGSKAA